jgi:hypothetical protein
MDEGKLNIKQVRDALGLSYQQVIRLVRSCDLRAYHYVGGVPVTKEEVTEDTYGLRFRASDVNEMLEQFLVK